MTPQEAVRGCAGPVGRLGGAWMFDEQTAARGAELGLKGWSWYHCGRGGVLGDGDASVVVAAFGFFPPALQTKAWDRGKAVLPPSQTAREYALACAAWGRRVFASVEDAGRLADLGLAVADAAPIAGMPLFAGWRALVPTLDVADGPGRLALALQVLREHRGSAHLVAVVAQGVDPLQAVVSGRYGTANAEFFGWPQPWPDPETGKAAMAAAEERTDELVRPAFAALSVDERAELTEGVRALRV
jgi:hypothetical protein